MRAGVFVPCRFRNGPFEWTIEACNSRGLNLKPFEASVALLGGPLC